MVSRLSANCHKARKTAKKKTIQLTPPTTTPERNSNVLFLLVAGETKQKEKKKMEERLNTFLLVYPAMDPCGKQRHCCIVGIKIGKNLPDIYNNVKH